MVKDWRWFAHSLVVYKLVVAPVVPFVIVSVSSGTGAPERTDLCKPQELLLLGRVVRLLFWGFHPDGTLGSLLFVVPPQLSVMLGIKGAAPGLRSDVLLVVWLLWFLAWAPGLLWQ